MEWGVRPGVPGGRSGRCYPARGAGSPCAVRGADGRRGAAGGARDAKPAPRGGGQRGQGLPDLPWTDPSLTLPGAQQKRQDGGGVHGEVGVQRIWRRGSAGRPPLGPSAATTSPVVEAAAAAATATGRPLCTPTPEMTSAGPPLALPPPPGCGPSSQCCWLRTSTAGGSAGFGGGGGVQVRRSRFPGRFHRLPACTPHPPASAPPGLRLGFLAPEHLLCLGPVSLGALTS